MDVVYLIVKHYHGGGFIDAAYSSAGPAIRRARRLAVEDGVYGKDTYPRYQVHRVPIQGSRAQYQRHKIVWKSSDKELLDPDNPDRITAYVDGACQTAVEPNIGGWAVIAHVPEHGLVKLRGSERDTTSQRMELMAAIKLFEELTKLQVREKQVLVVSDSQYLVDGMNIWISKWLEDNWKGTGSKRRVKNVDLWQKLIEVTNDFAVTWQRIPRSSHDLQKEADRMAKRCLGEDLKDGFAEKLYEAVST